MQNFIETFANLQPNEKGKFGIENIKGFFGYVLDALPKFKEVFADGKITFWEALQITPTLIAGTRILANIKIVAKELLDLGEQDILQLIDYLATLPLYQNAENKTLRNAVSYIRDILFFFVAGSSKLIDFANGVPFEQSSGIKWTFEK